LKRPDGGELYVLVTGVPRWHAGEVIGAIAVLTDISERKKAEEKIQRQNAYLAALHETTLGLVNRLEPTDLLENIIAQAASLLGTPHGYLYLVESGQAELELKVGVGLFDRLIGFRLQTGEGMAGKVQQTGQPLVVNDYDAWPGRSMGIPYGLIQAVMGVPLHSGAEVVGVLGMAYVEGGRTFTDDKVELLSRFAQLASLALDNARLYANAQQELVERKRAERRSAAFASLAQELNSITSAQEAARIVVRVADELIGWDACSLSLRIPGSDWMRTVLNMDLVDGRRVEVPPVQPGGGEPSSMARRVMVEGKQLILRPVEATPSPEFTRFGDVSRPSASLLYVPIRNGPHVTGVLTIQSYTANAYTLEDLDTLQALADYAAGALDRIRAEEALAYEHDLLQALMDDLGAQKELFENLVAVARATTERPDLEATLQNALDVAASLTQADRGSLFLLDEGGRVIQSILVHNQRVTPAVRLAHAGRVLQEGLASWAVRQRQAALIVDTLTDERWLEIPEQPLSARSALSVPILSGSVVLGVLTLTHSQPDHFTGNQALLMQAAADQMSLALRNAQVFEAQRQAAARQAALYGVLDAVSQTLDVESAARLAVRAIHHATGWPNVGLLLSEPGQRHLRVVASTRSEAVVNQTIPVTQGVVGRTFVTARTQHVPDVRLDPDYITVSNTVALSELAVPLLREGKILGVLNLERNELDAFDEEDILLAESLAGTVALALDNTHLYRELNAHLADLSMLYGVAQMVTHSLRLEEVLPEALSAILTSMNFEAGLIALAGPVDGQLRLATSQGLSPELTAYFQGRRFEDTLSAYAHQRQESFILADLEHDGLLGDGERVQEMASLGVRAFATVPLLHHGQSLGVVSLFAGRPLLATTSPASLLAAVGHQMASAIANARLHQVVTQSQVQLQALVEASRDGIILINMERQILVVNAAALRLLRLPGQPANWIGRSIADAFGRLKRHAPAVVRVTLSEMRRVQRGDEPPGEGEYEVSPYIIRWTNLPVLVGEFALGRLLVLHDVTQERLLEEMREDLTHTMVHDLRNPLTGILGALEVLQASAGVEPGSTQQRLLAICYRNGQRMINLVNAILDVSRLESGQMPLEYRELILADLVAEALQLQGVLASEKEIVLENEVDPDVPFVWADRTLLGRVLQNLVDNAVKFTPPGGEIRVAAGLKTLPGSPAVVQVTVSDTGPGIPAELQSRLFQKFVTGQEKGRGSGLGLVFCRLVVEAHGGKIWVESTPGQGSTFTFALPLEPGQ
ncbi:MAG: GAF domain-containing protein, partial [Chloroflexi bacterium]|nr:GAF domain-containing protein [Chloroflexota bacterium]